MPITESLAGFGQKLKEKGSGLVDTARSIMPNNPTVGQVDKLNNPHYTTIGSGSYTPMKRGDSTSNILSKMFNIMVRDEQVDKKKRKQDIRYLKSIDKIKERRNQELIDAFSIAFHCDCAGTEKTKPKKRFKGFGMVGLGVAGLLFAPDVMAMITGFEDDVDDFTKKFDDLKFEFDPTSTQPPSFTEGDYSFTGTKKPPPELENIFQRVGEKENISPELLKAISFAESSFDTRATSTRGAMGLMQIMPDTATRYNVPRGMEYDPEANVTAGAKYLKDLLKMFDNNLELAIAAYNAGEGNIRRFGDKVPPFKETQEFVKKVLSNLQSNEDQVSANVGTGKFIIPESKRGTQEVTQVDPRLMEILQRAADKQGHKITFTSGKEGRVSRTHNHPIGQAVDVQIDNLNSKDMNNFRVYEEFAQVVKKTQEEIHPELGQIRWGGYFTPGAATGGVLDIMHFDLDTDRQGMGVGSWEQGLNPSMKNRFNISESKGLPLLNSPTSNSQQTYSVNKTAIFNISNNNIKSLSMKPSSTNSALMDKQFGK